VNDQQLNEAIGKVQFQEISGADGSPLLTGIEVTFVKPSE